jgi:hypothetical protein
MFAHWTRARANAGESTTRRNRTKHGTPGTLPLWFDAVDERVRSVLAKLGRTPDEALDGGDARSDQRLRRGGTHNTHSRRHGDNIKNGHRESESLGM